MAEVKRTESGVPVGVPIQWVRQRYIEMSKTESDGARTVRDFLVWVAHFAQGIAWWEVAMDDKKGRVIRVERSR